MYKTLIRIMTMTALVVGLFFGAAPAFASSGSKGEIKGLVSAVDAAAGTLTISPFKGGADVTLSVDAFTKIKRNGKSAALTDVLAGDKVEAKYNQTTMLASKLEVKLNLAELKGTVAAIDAAASTVTITPSKGGTDVTLTVDAFTKIKRSGKPALLTDLVVGDRVEVKYNPVSFLADKIEVKSGVKSTELKGIIAAIDSAASAVTITPSKGGADVTLFVDAATFIKKNGVFLTLADLMVGDMVEAKYNSVTFLASKIEVKTPELKGTISAIDLTAGTLTVTPQYGGADVTFTVDASTKIERDDAFITLADLLVGERVEVKYDAATLLAFKVEAD